MLDNLKKYKILLASNSPRRHELLAGLDIKFDVYTKKDISETYPGDLPLEEIPVYLARKKAEAYIHEIDNETLVITADTIVIVNGRVLEKPQNREEAIAFLKILSGNAHTVITGVCISTGLEQKTFAEKSEVRFNALEQSELEYYVDKYRPYDKAGAYGIQEWIGYVGIESIKGSFYNVMGLPVSKVYQALKAF